jgi:hypothetical protein
MNLEKMAKAAKSKYEYIDRQAIKDIVDILSESNNHDENLFKQLVEVGKTELDKAILRCIYRKAGYEN